MSKEQQCSNCRYWKGDVEVGSIGSCRYNPPSVIGEPVTLEAVNIYEASWSPVTADDDWCGQWKEPQ